MKRRLWPYGIVFAAGLFAAQRAVDEGEQKREQGREWQRFPRQALSEILYTSKESDVQIQTLGENLAWISHKKSDGETKRFLGRESMDEFWKALNPLWAQKLIGEAGSLSLQDYGLDPPQGSLRIKSKDGQSAEFLLGNKGFQSADVFVLDRQKKTVFLWERKPLTLMDLAPERLALEFPLAPPGKPYARVQLVNPFGSQTWLRTQGAAEESRWKRDAGEEDPAFAAWLDRLQKLRIDAYASPEETRSLMEVAPKIQVLFTKDDGTKVPLAFVQEGKDGRIWLKDQRLPVLLLMDQSKTGLLISDAEPLIGKK